MRSITTTLLLLSASAGLAQSHTIAEPSITTCQAAFLDSGGEGASGYGDNENFTSTICPDNPGDAISLQFVTFELSTAGTSPLDLLTIYDGPDTSAPLIGSWSGSNSPGIISASFANTSGCLTVTFTSNESGQGVFAAYISCFEPCEPPMAIAEMVGLSIPALACQGGEITFDASASTAASGFNITEYQWIFDDGTLDSLTGPVVSHSFTEPGEYMVQVLLTDDNECQSTNLVDLQVLVSTTPNFSATGIADTVLCQGATLTFNATGVEATEWSAIPEANFGDGLYLPDDQSQPFSSSLQLTGFSPGATITDESDLASICVSMEHSYMGDLVLSVTCPSGQSVIMHQQGGTTTFIGDALDGETDPPTPGTCMEYCWSPFATNGTFIDNLTNTQPSTVTAGFNVLIPGTYETVEPLSDLVGCPLNGTWTFTAADLYAADDGFVCSWQVVFDESLYPDLTSFTPDLGIENSDSASWSGPGIVPDPNDPLQATAVLNTPGTFDYTFTVTDNFGCSYDTTMTIVVNPSPQGDLSISGDSQYCAGSLAFLNAASGFDTYSWSNGSFGPNISVTAGTYTVTVGLGACFEDSESFTVVEVPMPQPVITGPTFSCGGTPVTLTTTEPYTSYLWTGGSNASSIAATTGTYTVSVTNADGCTAMSDPYVVLVGNDPVAAIAADPPSPQSPGVTVDFTDLSTVAGSNIVDWSWNFGDGSTSDLQNPSPTFNFPGTYAVTLVVTSAEGCTDTIAQHYVVRPNEVVIPNIFSPNSDGVNDMLVFENVQYYHNQLAIFNRWGQKIYEKQDYQNAWHAPDVPAGTYYFTLLLTESGKEYKGDVTIVR